jgi:hypothetical protein
MKKTLLAALLAGAVMTSGARSASVVTSGNAAVGDIILGFQDTVKNIDYLVDLGPLNNLQSLLSRGVNLGTDLTTAFGASWSSDANLYFGLFGINSDKTSVWASTLSGNSAFPFKVAGALTTTLQHYTTMVGAFNTSGTILSTGVEFTGASNLGYSDWTGNNPTASPSSAFAVYNQSLEAGVAAKQTLDFYQTGNSGGSSQAIYNAANGVISLSSSGVISAVPEPSTYALAGLGALLLVIAYRRNTKNAKNATNA